MPKLNILAAPLPARRVEAIRFTLEGQGEGMLYLREPSLPDWLKILDRTDEQCAQWLAPNANRYPHPVAFIPMSRDLWMAISAAELLQADAAGDALEEEERYGEAELVGLAVADEAAFNDLIGVIADMRERLNQRVERYRKNGAGESGPS